MSEQWITVYSETGFDEEAIKKAALAAGRAPDHEEDPIYEDGVRLPRGLEWDVDNDSAKIMFGLDEAGFEPVLSDDEE